MFEFIYNFKETLAVCGFMLVTMPIIAYIGYKVIMWIESKFGLWKDEIEEK